MKLSLPMVEMLQALGAVILEDGSVENPRSSPIVVSGAIVIRNTRESMDIPTEVITQKHNGPFRQRSKKAPRKW